MGRPGEKRDYRKEYDEYHSKPTQKKRRAKRNAAAKKAKCPPGKEADHTKALDSGGTNKSVRCVSKKTNRGWRKGKPAGKNGKPSYTKKK